MFGIKRFKSINFTLWATLCIFSLCVVVVLGVCQISLLSRTIKNEMRDQLKCIGDEISTMLNNSGNAKSVDSFSEVICTYSYDNKVFCWLFEEDGTLSFSTAKQSNSEYAKTPDFNIAIEHLNGEKKQENGSVLFDRHEAIAYANRVQIDNQNYILYVLSPTNIATDIVSVLEFQIMLFACIIILVSLLVSIIISNQLSKPINELANSAKRMAKGDFTVDFTGKHLYTEMDELAESLNYAKDEISKADGLQKELIANISHDLKTPLTIIKSYASLIYDVSGANQEKCKKHANIIIEETEHLTSLVNDILNLSKLGSNIEVLNIKVFNLSELTKKIAHKFDYLVESEGYSITLDIDENLFTTADEDKISQVVYNLISNAVNYTGEDKSVKIELKGSYDLIHFNVSDTGRGIPAEEIEHIWDRYYRSKSSHKRPVSGTGLGLSIIKTILVRHDFKFGIVSEEGKGSAFYVCFPLSKN